MAFGVSSPRSPDTRARARSSTNGRWWSGSRRWSRSLLRQVFQLFALVTRRRGSTTSWPRGRLAVEAVMTEMAKNESPSGAESQQESPPPVPLWVKVFVGGAIVLVVIFVAMHLTGHSMGGH